MFKLTKFEFWLSLLPGDFEYYSFFSGLASALFSILIPIEINLKISMYILDESCDPSEHLTSTSLPSNLRPIDNNDLHLIDYL